MNSPLNLRKEWFKHVAETHRKLVRKKATKDTTRREAMKVASETWEKVKKKIQKRHGKTVLVQKPVVDKSGNRGTSAD